MLYEEFMEAILREEDYICGNCKYFGCDRSRNCETICEKWVISEFVLEDLLEVRERREAEKR